MSIPLQPYLQKAVFVWNSLVDDELNMNQRHNAYIKWLQDQGVITPIGIGSPNDISKARIEFTDEESEVMFLLRFS